MDGGRRKPSRRWRISDVATTASDPPIEGAEVRPAREDDAAELLVLQRCCWVDEAIANETLDIGALHETLEDVRGWIAEWTTWCVRIDGRLVGAVRAHRDGNTWEIGRLMVAPDLQGRGLARELLARIEAAAPDGTDSIALVTGIHSKDNQRMYRKAGYRPDPEQPDPRLLALRKRRRRPLPWKRMQRGPPSARRY